MEVILNDKKIIEASHQADEYYRQLEISETIANANINSNSYYGTQLPQPLQNLPVQPIPIPNRANFSQTNNSEAAEEDSPDVIQDKQQTKIKVRIRSNSHRNSDSCNTSYGFSKDYKSNNSTRVFSIANMYIYRAYCFGFAWRIDGEHLVPDGVRPEKFSVFVTNEDIVDENICKVFISQGIDCFVHKRGLKQISSYIYQLMRQPGICTVIEAPQRSGFSMIGGKYFFTSADTIEEEGFPPVTNKGFVITPKENARQAVYKFVQLVSSYPKPEIIMFLCIIRVMALLTNPLFDFGLRFKKLILISGDPDKLRVFLQIYNRDDFFQSPEPTSDIVRIVRGVLPKTHDDLLLLSGENSTGTKAALLALHRLIYENYEFEVSKKCLDFDCIAAVITDSPILMEQVMNIELPDEDITSSFSFSPKTITDTMYELDKLIVRDITMSTDDFRAFIYDCISKQYTDKMNCELTIFMTIFKLIRKQVIQYQETFPVSVQKMLDYIVRITGNSVEESADTIVKEFAYILNKCVVSGKIELVMNCKLSSSFGASGNVPVILMNEELLLIENEEFEMLASMMSLADKCCNVRNALKKEGLLKINCPESEDGLKYKATLYGGLRSGTTSVTAVSASILSDEARKMIRGGAVNIIPCRDDGALLRVFLGTDQLGQSVYWSVGHSEAQSGHMACFGKSGSGKTVGVSLIAKQLFEQGQTVVYLHYKNSNAFGELASHGFGADYVREYCFEAKTDDILKGRQIFDDVFDQYYDRKIIVFNAERYDASDKNNDTEKFLKALYSYVSDKSELNIFLVIDEAHKLDHKKGGALYDIYNMGRGNGFHLIAIYQGLNQLTDKLLSMVNQADIKLVFKLGDDSEAVSLAEKNFLKPYRDFAREIFKQPKKHCFVLGLIEDSEGDLQENRYIGIRIPEIDC